MRAFTALVNPISGGGHAAQQWAPLASRDRVGRRRRTRRADPQPRARGATAPATAATAGRIVVAVGGDGLVRDVAEGVVAAGRHDGHRRRPGAGNDLARTLDVPTDVAALADLLLHAEPRTLDVIDLDGTVVVGNVYCGIDSVSNAIINANRRIPARLLYRLAPVRAILGWQPPTFTVTIDGAVRVIRAHSIVVANSGAYGHGLRIVPSAVLDDGRLDVLLVGAGPRRAVVVVPARGPARHARPPAGGRGRARTRGDDRRRSRRAGVRGR